MSTRTADFAEPKLGFAVRRPAGWHFERPAWLPAAEPLPLAATDWTRRGREPFLQLVRDRCEPRRPRPALRACCRPLASYSTTAVLRLLREHGETVLAELQDGELLASSFDAIVGGRRAAHVRFRYSVPVRDGRHSELWRVMTQCWLVLGAGLAFTISATSCAEERRFDEDDFLAVLSSVRIDHREVLPKPPLLNTAVRQ